MEVENRLEKLVPSCIERQLESPGNDHTDCLENHNRLRKVSDFVVSAAECLLDLCSSSNTSIVDKNFFILS